MLWPLLGSLFSLSVLSVLILTGLFIFKPSFWNRSKKSILLGYGLCFFIYALFIFFFTGPIDLNDYLKRDYSPYKLPWEGGVSRLVAQGNRSFTSHRGIHLYAWDFFMANGTEVLAAREGKVIAVLDTHDGIGLHSNYIKLEHEDGQRSGYFHIQYKSSLVKIGDEVRQGQPLALSGMVGQTIFPHLHFAVFNKEETTSLPISFYDVEGGVPLAGHFYKSGNSRKTNF